MLALAGHEARRWEPKRLALPPLHHPRDPRPAEPAASCCTWPTESRWASLIIDSIGRLRNLPAPAT